MQTVTNKTELLLNSRPLRVLHDDDLEEPFTPNQRLYGCQLHFNNYKERIVDGVFPAHKWIEYLEIVFNHFWKRWHSACIPSLLNYQKPCNRQNQITLSAGDIGNIYDNKVPGHKWLFQRIYEVITGKDDTVTGAKLFVGKMKKTVERPTNKLYPAEYFTELTIPAEDENIEYRPRRQGAIPTDIFCFILIYEIFGLFQRYLKHRWSVKFPIYFWLNSCCNVDGPS